MECGTLVQESGCAAKTVASGPSVSGDGGVDFVLVLFVALAVHRLWLYEEIFRPLSSRLAKRHWAKPITCPACFVFWAGVVALGLVTSMETLPWMRWVVIPLAVYPIGRAVVTWYWIVGAVCRRISPWYMPVSGAGIPGGKKPCSCKDEAPGLGIAAAVDSIQPALPLVVLLTTFYDFERVYSLTTVVLDQAAALAGQGYRVEIWVQIGCDLKALPVLPPNVTVKEVVPKVTWVVDEADPKVVKELVAFLEGTLVQAKPVAVIAHDLLFQEWFYCFAAAIHQAKTPGVRWWHQCHSSAGKSKATEKNKYRRTIPAGHKLISVSHADVSALADYYSTDKANVVVVPNARVPVRNPVASAIIRRERLTEVDLVQVYPLSGTRLVAKGVGTVIEVFAKLKEMGHSVRLVIANGHSLGQDVKKEVERFKNQAGAAGLDVAGDSPEVVFISESYPEYAAGLPGEVVADLMQAANLFIFPTITEACSLVLMEAALAGNMLVLNSDVPALADVIPRDQAIWFPFGDAMGKVKAVDVSVVAESIDAAYRADKVLRAKRTVLSGHSIESLGKALVEVISTR